MTSSMDHRELELPNWDKTEQKQRDCSLNTLLGFWVGCAVAIRLSGSYSVVDPDDYKLYEWLFPWFCGFVQWEQ